MKAVVMHGYGRAAKGLSAVLTHLPDGCDLALAAAIPLVVLTGDGEPRRREG